jgi:peptidoglycan/LPS O-acetylase OafA/YrhL
MPSSNTLTKIAPLTSVRFLAAIYVVFYHTFRGIPSLHRSSGAFARFLDLGYISVPFFFLLSGFILAIVYLKDERPVDPGRFYLARFARIYPLYLASILLDTPRFLFNQRLVVHSSLTHTITVFAVHASLLQSWLVGLRGINSPSWSLSNEAFSYLIFPFAGAAIWRLRGRTMWFFALLLYLGGNWIVQIAANMQTDEWLLKYHPLGHVYEFLFGICLANMFAWIGRNSNRTQALSYLAPWLLVASVALLLAIPIFNLPYSAAQMQHGLLLPIFAVVILAIASGNRWVSAVFSVNWLVILGEASFALYLIHMPLYMAAGRRVILRWGLPGFAAYLIVTLSLSVVSFYWLETPARRWILHWAHIRSQKITTASALVQ